MWSLRISTALLAPALALMGGPAAGGTGAGASVEYNRDIRPILAANCFACHGPDAAAREAGLRLDRRDAATAPRPGGEPAVIPGDSEASGLVFRVSVEEDTLRMPPPHTGKRLTPEQVETLRRWVESGAPYETHWSLVPPSRPAVPAVRRADWPRNPIDRFILARLESAGVAPSPEADHVTLARRLALDLTGLPPSAEMLEALRPGQGPGATDRLIDRLLASPRFGERMAVGWLDLVRFADTVGFHSDVPRAIAPYRDYVIRSFNENKPFDRFTVEQLAGDLLAGGDVWARVGSAYNMLGRTTEEGGAQPKEYLAKYAADRVRNLGSVWLGATLGCAECHDHKYDPVSTEEFYRIEAIFADIVQDGVGTPKPSLELPTPEQQAERRRLHRELDELDDLLVDFYPLVEPARAAVERRLAELEAGIRRTIVTVSGPPRNIRVLPRGDWLDESGPVAEPGVPECFGPLPESPPIRTRLDLARWLTTPEHPRTARVVVNRLWRQFFGGGFCETLEDLGTQGDLPSHPDLLDWLAVELVESGWDLKHIIRLIVTSATYAQSSAPREDLKAIDPNNRLFARQGAFRLDAETIRDQALAIAGLLDQRIGGESIRPYQPEEHWRFLNFPTREYIPSTGLDQHRRGLYVHWQRTLLHPSLAAFDAPSREECTARRATSITPQSALVLLNDPTYVEAARAFAARIAREGGPSDASRVDWAFRQAVGRAPSPREAALLLDLLQRERAAFREKPDAARELLDVAQAPREREPVGPAAWTQVARALLNLHETITRE